MANDVIGGIRWVRNLIGRGMPVEEAVVISAGSGNIFTGDPIKPVSDGTVIVAAGGDTTTIGICIGVKQYKGADGVVRSGGSFLPTGTTYTGAPSLDNPQASIIRYIPVKGQEFEIDMNTAMSTETAATDIYRNNVDFSVGSGSTSTGRSACVADNSSPGTGAANLRIRGKALGPKNDVTAVNWKALVEFNEFYNPGAITTTGV